MPLDTITLKDTLKAAFMTNLHSGATSQQRDEIENLSSTIANAMKIFVEGATITYVAGLTTAPGGGPVTGVFTNTIS